MSVTSGFFNSLNGDRKYNAEQMSAIFDGIINDGILSNVGTAFTVTAGGGNSVSIGIGRAWFNSTWLYNDSILTLTLDDADVILDRIDAIVIEINHTESVRAGTIKVVKGTPSSTPSNPVLEDSEYVHQHPLAYIYRTANDIMITQADITRMIGTSACPYVTGILQVQNIDNVVIQWQAQWQEYFASWSQQIENDTDLEENQFKNWMVQTKAEFNAWWATIQAILDQDTAGKLTSDVTELQDNFDTLVRERVLYSDLEDSTGDTIEDSSGTTIRGRTAFAVAGEEVSTGGNSGGSSSGGGNQVIINEGFSIGDIMTTMRTNLGRNWLLCNGEAVSVEGYPELCDFFPSVSLSEIEGGYLPETYSQLNMRALFGNATIAEGKYLLSTYTHNQEDGVYNDKVGFLYSDIDDLETFTYVNVHNNQVSYVNIQSQSMAKMITYVNGHYILVFVRMRSDSAIMDLCLAYSSNINGPWTVVTIAEKVSKTAPNYAYVDVGTIKYLNGQYIIGVGIIPTESQSSGVVQSNAQTCVLYSSTLDGPWSKKVLYTSSSTSALTGIYYIDYVDGKYVFAGNCYNDATWRALVYWTSDENITSEGVTYVADKIDDWFLSCIYDIQFINGRYVFTGTASNGTKVRYPCVFYSGTFDSASEPWENAVLSVMDFISNKSSGESGTKREVSNLLFYNGFYMLIHNMGPYKAFSFSKSLSGPWEHFIQIESETDANSYIEKCVPFLSETENKIFILFPPAATNSKSIPCIYEIDFATRHLPSISVDSANAIGTYTYIKALLE